LIGYAIILIPIKPGSPKKKHYEYIRNGTCCIFLAFEPHEGKRLVCVNERRTMVDYADFMLACLQINILKQKPSS